MSQEYIDRLWAKATRQVAEKYGYRRKKVAPVNIDPVVAEFDNGPGEYAGFSIDPDGDDFPRPSVESVGPMPPVRSPGGPYGVIGEDFPWEDEEVFRIE